ncbi:MAG: APC family permease, partial [Rhodospirillales bacterium]|nr:APC family permease [Rhodospirillales bacterium]
MSDPTLTPNQGGSLQRSMKMLGTLLITLSAITPASSVFIIVPGIVSAAGTGAFISMLAGAFVGVCMALVYAELSSAYPLSGGEYAIVGRVVGPFSGFIVMGVNLVGSVLIPAVMALGMSAYLGVIFPNLSAVPTAIVTIAVTTAISILNVKTNAVLTGIFLVIEILALVVLVVLGFTHVSRPVTDLLLHPVLLGTHGLTHASAAAIGMATSVAIFAYNGYGSAVYFGEETHDAKKHIARAILWALVVTVA